MERSEPSSSQGVSPIVDLVRSASPPDPEFRSTRPGLVLGGLGSEPEAYLRLLANPFLGFTYLLVWVTALYQSTFGLFAGALTPVLVTVLLFGLWLIPMFMQYHCLDCGKTGRLSHWRNHSCLPSVVRREVGKRRRFRGPTPVIQVVLWIWLMMAAIPTIVTVLNHFPR